MRACVKCGGPLPVHNGRHRPRKFCTTCRPSRNRGTEQRVTEIRPGAQTDGLTLVAATTARLAELGRLGTPQSVLVLNLARSIDDGGHSGASLASLSGAYSRALVAAEQGADDKAEGDGVEWGVG